MPALGVGKIDLAAIEQDQRAAAIEASNSRSLDAKAGSCSSGSQPEGAGAQRSTREGAHLAQQERELRVVDDDTIDGLRCRPPGLDLALPGAGDTVRSFIWWRDGEERTDLDLTASLYDADFGHLEDVAYYNLKTYGGHHSGDIIAAPKGASEFIDIDITKAAARGARYVAMAVNVYSG